ncbi:MAG: rhomboid family intramembrane serine protease [Eubacteriaceae bacterium]|jgi:membrane associated rhomboid family serine protease|nr:rhomboid family intramembrane serine protease [Eubacteriaceae bacterium]
MKKLRLDFNAPVILSFASISLTLLILSSVFGGWVNDAFAIRYTSWLDLRMYGRLVTHVFAHAGLSHYTNNFLLILAIGPMVEEKYGSSRLLGMMAVTAILTGLINVAFFPHIMLMGASGIVFLLILLASFTNVREKTIPITFLLVCVLYIGTEVVQGMASNDNVSQLSHIAGGLVGSFFGFAYRGGKM